MRKIGYTLGKGTVSRGISLWFQLGLERTNYALTIKGLCMGGFC